MCASTSGVTTAIRFDQLWTATPGKPFWTIFCLWPKKRYKPLFMVIWRNISIVVWEYKSTAGELKFWRIFWKEFLRQFLRNHRIFQRIVYFWKFLRNFYIWFCDKVWCKKTVPNINCLCDFITTFWQSVISYCKILMVKALKWGILRICTWILYED